MFIVQFFCTKANKDSFKKRIFFGVFSPFSLGSFSPVLHFFF
uniref:Uncharacterized protein n=1 Tax=Anguilla anguilla TaxID=7936 RepID=A0A0E9WA96_ANGAN